MFIAQTQCQLRIKIINSFPTAARRKVKLGVARAPALQAKGGDMTTTMSIARVAENEGIRF